MCSLIGGIEREGYLSSWLVAGRRATQGVVITAIRKEGLLLCCCTCRLAFWARHSGLQKHHHIFSAGAVQHPGWRGPFWPSLLGFLAKPFSAGHLWDNPRRSCIGVLSEVVSLFASSEVSSKWTTLMFRSPFTGEC